MIIELIIARIHGNYEKLPECRKKFFEEVYRHSKFLCLLASTKRVDQKELIIEGLDLAQFFDDLLEANKEGYYHLGQERIHPKCRMSDAK